LRIKEQETRLAFQERDDDDDDDDVKSILCLLGINNINIFKNTVLNRIPDSERKEIILNVVNQKLINNVVTHVLCT